MGRWIEHVYSMVAGCLSAFLFCGFLLSHRVYWSPLDLPTPYISDATICSDTSARRLHWVGANILFKG